MNIKPSAAIRKNYNDISHLCKQSGEPVFLTKNGEGDLVVMDMLTFVRRESMLNLREALIQADADIKNGNYYTIEETAAAMKVAITETINAKKAAVIDCRQDYGWLL